MDDLQPGARVGEYRIEHELGRGGMSVVYAATHLVIGKRAAIKVVRPLLCADATGMIRAIQEARAINQISHPNVVDVYAYGRLPDGRCYLVMERLEGETLFERMGRRPIPLSEAVDILGPLCDALEAAHRQGVVHRDVKPANVFLVPTASGRDLVKLLDFGLAKILDEEAGVTQQGAVLGTPDYIAPEQARGGIVDTRADVYSLGVVAFEMLAGRLPFSGDGAAVMLRSHIEDPAPRLRDFCPQLPPQLEALVDAMLHKDPRKRPALAEVRRVLASLRRPTMELRRPARWRVALAAVALLLGAGAVALAARHKKPSVAHADPPPIAARVAAFPSAPAAAPAVEIALPAPVKKKAKPHRRKPDDALIYPF
jgi:eukaryotic-like serine/threonine-protein kinase